MVSRLSGVFVLFISSISVAQVINIDPERPMGDNRDTLREETVIQEVLRNNDRALAARYMERAANYEAAGAGAWDDPMLMLGVQNLPTNFDLQMDPMTMRTIGLTMTIPVAGQKGLEKKAATFKAEAAADDRRAMELDLVTAARIAFYDVYYMRRIEDDLKEQRSLFTQILESSTAKLKTNQAGQDEVLAVQADLWRLEAAILDAGQRVISAERTLNSLRGLEPETKVPSLAAPDLAVIPASSEEWTAAAQINYPPLNRLQKEAESYNMLSAAARRMQWPMLQVGAEYGLRSGEEMGPTGDPEPRDNMVSFQGALSIPIFNGRQQRQMSRSMAAMSQNSLAELRQMRREIRATLDVLYEQYKTLSQSLTYYRDRIIPAMQDAYRSALAGYVSNRTSYASLLTYAVSLYRDRIQVNELANRLARTKAQVEYYTTDPEQWAEARLQVR